MRKKLKLAVAIFLLITNGTIAQQNDTIPIYDSLTIKSKVLHENRVINVWTPLNYNELQEALQVLYMPDGGVKEDFPHMANTVAKLVENKSIPPTILVGIENTKRKRDLTGPTDNAEDKTIAPIVGESNNFRAFIKKELIPEINKNYRTSTKKGIIGESLAGFFVVETLLLDANLFDFYIAMDPSLWWNDQLLVKDSKTNLKNLPKNNIRFWFAGSSVQNGMPFISNLNKQIKSVNPEPLKWKYSDEPDEDHSTIFRATKEKALIWTLGNGE